MYALTTLGFMSGVSSLGLGFRFTRKGVALVRVDDLVLVDADDEEVAQFAGLPQQIDVVLVYKLGTH